jgi:hypothetical protein
LYFDDYNTLNTTDIIHRHSNSGPPIFVIWSLPRLWYGSLSGSISFLCRPTTLYIIARAVERKSAKYTENSGFASPTLGQHISRYYSQALELRTPHFRHLVPAAIMVWIFVWKYIFEPFIHILQHFVLQLSRSTNFCF